MNAFPLTAKAEGEGRYSLLYPQQYQEVEYTLVIIIAAFSFNVIWVVNWGALFFLGKFYIRVCIVSMHHREILAKTAKNEKNGLTKVNLWKKHRKFLK